MKALYHRIEESGDSTWDMADALLKWVDDRLLQDDMLQRMRWVFPDAPDEQLLAGISEIGRVFHQP